MAWQHVCNQPNIYGMAEKSPENGVGINNNGRGRTVNISMAARHQRK